MHGWNYMGVRKEQMMRLIDADALIGALHNCTFLEGDDRSICYGVIQRQPTINPVKQGKWIKSHIGTIAEGYFCTNCGKRGHREDFCPHCGAYMKGARDE